MKLEKLEKLEKLSCLKIQDSQRCYILKSLEGVMEMLHEVDELPSPDTQVKFYEAVNFRQDSEVVPEKTSLHLDNGLFLAPKVIKKD